MESASRRTGILAYAGLALLTALSAGACRRGRGRTEAADAQSRPATARLEGRVTDEGDRAVPEARVLAFGPLADADTSGRHETRSDRGGRFGFEGLRPGRYTLLVEAVGLTSSEPPTLDVPGAAPVIRLAGQGRSVSGTVVSAGAPVPGSRVRLGGAGGPLARATVSDDAGRFVFHGLGDAAYSLRATKGLLASSVAADVPPDATQGAPDAGRAPVQLELGLGLGVEGVVVDEGGRGLAGAEVRAEATPDDPLADAVSTRPDGKFQLGPLPPGRFRLAARAPGYLLRAAPGVSLSRGAAVPSQRLELVRAASAEGRVVDARGAPLADALVRCGGGGADLTDLAVIFAPLPLAAEAAAVAPGVGHGLGATKVTRTDARGAFRLDDLLPGPLRLAVTRPPLPPLETDTASLAPGEHRDLGVLTLPDVASAEVVAGAEPPAVTPAHASATLTGVARDSGNRPLARARVRAWPLGTNASSTPALATALTDAGGHFTLARVAPVTLLLELDHPAYPVTFANAAPGATAELTAPIPGGIDGEVRELVTGATIPRATVAGVGPNGQRASAGANKREKKGAATFRLLRLTPGHWTLTASAPGYRAAVRDVDVPVSPILGETSVRGVRLELELER